MISSEARGAGQPHREAMAAATSPATFALIEKLTKDIATLYDINPTKLNKVPYGLAQPGKMWGG